MRTFSCLAVSLTSLLLAAGSALADPSGFISGGVGTNQFQYGDDDPISSPDIRGRASATQALTPVLNVQGDVVLEYRQLDYGSNNARFYEFTGAAHLFYREPERFLAGAFVQFDHETLGYTGDDDSFKFSRGLIGAEGQVFLDEVTLYGQVGFLSENLYDGDVAYGGVFATAQLRYFLTPDLKIDVHGSLKRAGNEFFDFTTAGIGAGIEYRLPESPISLFGTLDYFSSQSEAAPVNETRAMVGVKFNFGSDSLKDQDRNGTSLDPYRAPFYVGGAT